MKADIEMTAELPPRRVLLHLDMHAGQGLGVVWEASGDAQQRGAISGPPAEVARAVGALVLRLAGAGEGPQAVQDEEPTRRIARIAP